jgi:uncharacterized protein (TIGR02246 family)
MRSAAVASIVALAASFFEQYNVKAFTTTTSPVTRHAATIPHSHKKPVALQMGILEQLFGLENENKQKDVISAEEATKPPVSVDKSVQSLGKPTQQEVRNLFNLWNEALATLDAGTVSRRYSKDALLLPTVSDQPRNDHESIKNYFETFLLNKPQGKILESHVTVGENGKWCQDNGIYEFTMGATGDKVKARYSFFYVLESDATSDGMSVWKISHHHSSPMPEEGVPLPTDDKLITKNKVRNLFHLWNDALATGDPKVVAARYADKAVLLPTVSDLPRTTPELIEDYFVNFLKLSPQGKIVESFVDIGPSGNWCSDSGIYVFTMAAEGNRKVRARYSFVYTRDENDGQWKISHHHSSQMPEELQPKGTAGDSANKDNKEGDKKAVLSESEIRKLFDLWNGALASGDPNKVAARYASQPVLLATISDTPRKSQAAIVNYFDNFLKSQPKAVIKKSVTHAGDSWCEDCGVYEFTMGATGDKVLARYSFVYVLEDGEWKIAHHHSSMMPEPMFKSKEQHTDGEILSESQVKELFAQWKRALATESPKKVAALYAKDALLLPTLTNVPRQTPAAIKDYFSDFLKKEPQVTLKDTVILSGPKFAKIAGVYDLVMGTDASKVSERFSFVFTKDDTSGEWKIAHHHSSAMPEAMLDAGRKYKLLEEVMFPENDIVREKASKKVKVGM